jgi:hypothetical protein
MPFSREPAIAPLTAEIYALRIEGKRVTPSVFKQLREEPLISHEGTLNGTAWGVVNHHPDKCETRTPAHRHIVWMSSAGKLLRDRLTDEVPGGDQDDVFCCEEANRRLIFDTREWIHGRRPESPLRRNHQSAEYHHPDHIFAEDDLQIRAVASEVALAAADAKCRVEEARSKSFEPPIGAVKPRLPDLVGALGALDAEVASWGLSREQVLSDYRSAITRERDRRQRHRELHLSLLALPQLFIAV